MGHTILLSNQRGGAITHYDSLVHFTAFFHVLVLRFSHFMAPSFIVLPSSFT